MTRAFALQPHDEELRDPTREELFNGPAREKLPAAIQQMAQDETACTFCGVSYFVFSEVQELQATVKRYKKTFHEFVRFMERERKVSQELKGQVVALKSSFDDGALVFRAAAQRLAGDSERLRARDVQLSRQLELTQRDADHKQSELLQVQAQCRRAEEEWKMASALADQKLRNEILHLSSQVEKCRLLTASQETEFAAERERGRATIKELELLVASSRASMSSLERQAVTERDVLKQQLLAASERVDAERETAKQLESQLRAVQQELQRIVASQDGERSTLAQLHGDVASLKLQILQHEKAKAALVGERVDLREQLDKVSELARTQRAEITLLEKRVEQNGVNAETCKQEYARELEKLRLKHGQAIGRMQRDHQRALDELKDQHKSYVEYLQRQTNDAAAASASTMQHALLETESRLREADKQAAHWKSQVQQSVEELQQARTGHQHTATRVQTLERQLAELHGEKRELADEVEHLHRQLDTLKNESKLTLEQAEHDTNSRLKQQFDDQHKQLQRQLESLQTKHDQLRHEHERLTKQHAANRKARDPEDDGGDDDDVPRRGPQQAWGDGSSGRRGSTKPPKAVAAAMGCNQESHELEKLVESLRRELGQKDKEISLLQQTVHRECLERTSLLEKMRSGKVLPDMCASSTTLSPIGDASHRRSSSTPRRDPAMTNHVKDGDDSEDHDAGNTADPSQPKASFYERLRRAGQRKPKPRKS